MIQHELMNAYQNTHEHSILTRQNAASKLVKYFFEKPLIFVLQYLCIRKRKKQNEFHIIFLIYIFFQGDTPDLDLIALGGPSNDSCADFNEDIIFDPLLEKETSSNHRPLQTSITNHQPLQRLPAPTNSRY